MGDRVPASGAPATRPADPGRGRRRAVVTPALARHVLALVSLVPVAAGCGSGTKPPAAAANGSTPGPAATAAAATGTIGADTDTPGGTSAGDLAQRRIVRRKLPSDLRSIALEYEVLRIDEGDRPVAVDPAAHTFSVGDSFLVKIRPEDDLYVYVFNEDAAGNRTCLLPSRDEPPRLAKSGEEILLPDDGGYFTFEPPPGEEKLVVVALPEPTDDVRLLAASVFRARDAADAAAAAAEKEKADAALGTLRDRSLQSRGPVGAFVKRVEEAGGGRATHVEPPAVGQPASYGIAVAPAAGGQPELVLDIDLRSRAGR